MKKKKNYIRISVDAMSGDYGFKISVKASIIAIKKYPALHIKLVGDEFVIQKFINSSKFSYDKDRLSIVHSDEIVLMNDSPILALRKKKSSMRIALELVKQNIVDACVSSGNTGALLALSKYILNTLDQIDKPAIISSIPIYNNKFQVESKLLMLDLGANTSCSAKNLFQFALMASTLAESINKIKRPKIGLLNIGTEENKGLHLIRDAAEKIKNCKKLNYVGFLEGNEIFSKKADILVCDGFSGNIALKVMEGTSTFIYRLMKDSWSNNLLFKIFSIFVIPTLIKIKKMVKVDAYNGAFFLGIRGIIIKGHGSSKEEAFISAINQAIQAVENDLINKIRIGLAKSTKDNA